MEMNNKARKYQKVRKVLWWVLAANLLITVTKIILGILTGSLAVIADGFHSIVDSSSNLVGLAAIRLAARPADEQYPYGYQRFESLGTLAIGGLLLVAAWEIIQSVYDRFFQGAQPEITWLTFGLIALTLVFNIGVVILETRVGKKLQSEILLADASHTKTDLFVTGSVIGSLIGVWLGLPWLDMVVAVGVVALILRASIDILKRTGGSLADTARIDPQVIERVAGNVAGVQYVYNVRSRGTTDAIFVDLHVKVDPAMSTSQAHAVASEVERQVFSIRNNIVDAIVHIEPADLRGSSDWERISYGLRQIADGMGISFHNLHVHVNKAGEYSIELDLEIQADVTIKEAHKVSDEFEQRAKNFWPDASQITTHLEPSTQKLFYPKKDGDDDFNQKIFNHVQSQIDSVGSINVRSTFLDEKWIVTLILTMRGDISLVEAHDKVEEIKRSLLREFQEISRVVIHVEPEDENLKPTTNNTPSEF